MTAERRVKAEQWKVKKARLRTQDQDKEVKVKMKAREPAKDERVAAEGGVQGKRRWYGSSKIPAKHIHKWKGRGMTGEEEETCQLHHRHRQEEE